MEFDTLAMPLHTVPGNAASASASALDGDLNLEDFVAQEGEALTQGLAARASLAKKAKSASNDSPVIPRPVGARSSKHTTLLHEKYQALGIERPDFVFEGDSTAGWGVRMTFLGEALEGGGRYASKQEAKEALCVKALALVEGLEAEGKLQKSKKVRQPNEAVNPNQPTEKGPTVNWSGQLLEFQRANDAPQPTYTDYQIGTTFTCILDIDIDGLPTAFGSHDDRFTSKKAARQHAASLAVDYFKSQNLWPTNTSSGGGIKKRKPQTNPLPTVATPVTTPKSTTPAAATGPPNSVSYAQQAAQLATLLGLNTPEWRFAPADPTAPGFHTVTSHFKDGGPYAGPLGIAEHVFGKKKAKEECARQTLEILAAIRQRRLSYGQRMMNGEEREEEPSKDAVSGIKEEDRKAGVEEESDEFEDAVEEL